MPQTGEWPGLNETPGQVLGITSELGMSETIIDRGRGPEVAGTRITVYDIMDYWKNGWHHTAIASTLGISSQQVLAAICYIEEHKAEVMAEYQEMLDRCARGNPPEIQAKLALRPRPVPSDAQSSPASNGPGGHKCWDFWQTLTWQDTCQKHDLVLITANRNRRGSDSLEATIQEHNTASSLPVMTLADPDRVLNDRPYAEQVAERLIEYLHDIEHLRGAGRFYVP